jgi:hypothetical protein
MLLLFLLRDAAIVEQSLPFFRQALIQLVNATNSKNEQAWKWQLTVN